MAGSGTLTCARDGISTQLTCAKCQAPICPQCLVRTDVGLRCQSCAESRVPIGAAGRARRPIVIAAVAGVGALIVATALLLGGSSGRGSRPDKVAGPSQHVARPDLGFSLDLPPTWIVDVDQTPGSIFLAHAAPPRSSARIFRGQTDQPLEQTMVNVIDGLRQQGAHDFSQQPVQVGELPGIRLDYLASDGPAGAIATHSSYRVKQGSAVFSLSLSTTDASADAQTLADIASSFRLL